MGRGNPYFNYFIRGDHYSVILSNAHIHSYVSQVLSADILASRFEKEGVMNSKVGMDYRKMVLAPGGTHNITDHLTKFLGRPPSNEAFLKSRGILK